MKNSTLSWFAVGDYKKQANVVDGKETAKPKEVAARMSALYKPKATLQSIYEWRIKTADTSE